MKKLTKLLYTTYNGKKPNNVYNVAVLLLLLVL